MKALSFGTPSPSPNHRTAVTRNHQLLDPARPETKTTFCVQGVQGPALGDLGYRGRRLAEAGQALGITVEAIARGRDGQFIPAGICRVVERSFAWLSRYRRLNIIFERSKEHLIAFVAIAFISILSRRLKRLVVEELSA